MFRQEKWKIAEVSEQWEKNETNKHIGNEAKT